LLADPKRLKDFIDEYLNKPLEKSDTKFALWTDADRECAGQTVVNDYAYVYLAAISVGPVRSDTDNIGDWTKFEVAFFVPVRVQRCDSQGKLCTYGIGMLPVYTFLDNVTAAAARSEVLGIPTMLATFDAPKNDPNPWMT